MGEEDIRARLASTDAHILALGGKLDEFRKELQESIMEQNKHMRETHQRMHARMDAFEANLNELRLQIACLTPVIEAAQKHMANDVPSDVARDKAIARAALYIMGLFASGFVGWFFSRM